jgi:hypothetical protein
MGFATATVSRETRKKAWLLSPLASGDIIAAQAR